jgi:hypothetical protein
MPDLSFEGMKCSVRLSIVDSLLTNKGVGSGSVVGYAVLTLRLSTFHVRENMSSEYVVPHRGN